MRVIIKPAGLLLIFVSLIALVGLTFGRMLDSRSNSSRHSGSSPDLSSSAVTGQPSSAVPSQVLLMPDIASQEWQTLINIGKPVAATIRVVKASVPGHPYARRITNKKIAVDAWDIQLARPLAVALKRGKKIQLSYWARSKDSCPLTAVVEKNTQPYTRIIARTEILTPDWRQYTEEWVQDKDTPTNWAKMDFQLAHKVGEIELTGVVIRQIGN